MAKAVFVDKSDAFFKKNEAFTDMVLAHMAMDIETNIKTGGRTPVKTGDMKAETRHYKNAQGAYRVESDKNYAAAQELGYRNGSRPFRNYTTPGTGPGWFKGAIEGVLKNRVQYLEEARRALNL